MVTNVPITTGTGAVSVAAETVAGISFQRIEVMGQGGASVLAVNPDGSINASIIGTPAISFGAASVTVTVKAGSVMSVTNPASSVTQVRTDNASVITVAPAGSILGISGTVTAPAGSIMSQTSPAGSVLAVRTDNASVITTQPAGSVLAVSGTFVTPSGSIQSVTNPAGSVTAVRTDGASVISVSPAGSVTAIVNLAGSIMSTTNPAGSVTAVTMTAAAGSILSVTVPAGSVMQVRTDNASVITTQLGGSIMAVSAIQPAASLMATINPAGSVTGVRTDNASVIVITQASSIVGTYAEDAAHTSADKGVFALSVRNDTLASVTSNDGDYGAIALGPSGEVVVANAPFTKWVSGTASMLGGIPMFNSVTVIAAQGASVFTYVTGVQVANMGSASVLVSFFGATNSLVGYTIAPAGGGSNIPLTNGWKTNANGAFAASISGTASIFISAEGFISKS